MTSVPRTLPTPATPTGARRRSAGARHTRAGGIALLAVSAVVLAPAGTAAAAPAAVAVPLGTAEPFAVLAGASFSNTGTSVIAGDIGAADPAMVGTSSIVLTGTNHGDDGVTAGANAALTNARVTAAGQGPGDTISADLAGQRLSPGIYTSASSLSIAGPVPLVLDGGGDPDAVFLFQAGSTLITEPGTSVSLVNGATACNVFWEVGSSTTLGVDSVFRGVVLTLSDTTLDTRATLEGSVLTGGSVTLDSNRIIRPACATPPVTTPPVTTPPVTTPPGTTPPVTTAPVTTPPPATTPPVTTPPVATPPVTTAPRTASPTPGTPASGTGRSTPAASYEQVGQVPVGAVDTGDGSTS